jgi:hypothetical protein
MNEKGSWSVAANARKGLTRLNSPVWKIELVAYGGPGATE